MPSRFLMELGYDPYGASGGGSVGYCDKDGDGFTDFDENDFTESDFGGSDYDPFPLDVPVWE